MWLTRDQQQVRLRAEQQHAAVRYIRIDFRIHGWGGVGQGKTAVVSAKDILMAFNMLPIVLRRISRRLGGIAYMSGYTGSTIRDTQI